TNIILNDRATVETYTLSLHDALPISAAAETMPAGEPDGGSCATSLHLGSVTRAQIEDFLYREARLLDDWDLDTWLTLWAEEGTRDRKSTRLNSSHLVISYAVFCLKKK